MPKQCESCGRDAMRRLRCRIRGIRDMLPANDDDDTTKVAPVDLSYRRTLRRYFIVSVFHIIVAAVIGYAINWIAFHLQILLRMPAWVALLFQLTLLIVTFYFIEKFWHSIVEIWQSTTPGLLSNVVLIGTQFNLLNNLESFGRQLHLLS